MGLWIVDSGANTEEIDRGVAAALQVFHSEHVPPEYANSACQKDANGDEMTTDEKNAVRVWREAENAAIVECCKGWVRIPESVHLELA